MLKGTTVEQAILQIRPPRYPIFCVPKCSLRPTIAPTMAYLHKDRHALRENGILAKSSFHERLRPLKYSNITFNWVYSNEHQKGRRIYMGKFVVNEYIIIPVTLAVCAFVFQNTRKQYFPEKKACLSTVRRRGRVPVTIIFVPMMSEF